LELASDSAELKAIVRHAVAFVEDQENARFDVVVTLQATSPFRTGRQIDEAIDQLLANELDAVISLKELRSLMWRMPGGRLEPVHERAGRREDLEPFYQEDGAIRVLRRDVLDSPERLGQRVGHVLMDKMSALTIHDIYDFWLAERLASAARAVSRRRRAQMGMATLTEPGAPGLSPKSPHRGHLFSDASRPPGGVQRLREGYQVRFSRTFERPFPRSGTTRPTSS
jgi:hypothetical protein